MNPQSAQLIQDKLVAKVTKKYQQEGYKVLVEPQAKDLPFDLSGYIPDLIVKKSESEGYIIEIKTSARQTNIDRYREIAETVSQHIGWHFLLITGEDTWINNQSKAESLLSWEQIITLKKQSEHLIFLKENEIAFLSLWVILEAILRRQAEQASIPIERFPPQSLIKHLYSQGELSMEEYDKAMGLLQIRNTIFHGFQTPEINAAVSQLIELVNELISLWLPKVSLV